MTRAPARSKAKAVSASQLMPNPVGNTTCGAFEGIRSYNSLVFKLNEHIDRLYETAHTLMIDLSLTKKQMIKAITDTLKQKILKLEIRQ